MKKHLEKYLEKIAKREAHIEVRKPGKRHVVIDARIRRDSTGKPVDRLLEHLQALDSGGHTYSIILKPGDDWQPKNKNFTAVKTRFGIFSFNPLNQLLYAWQLYKLEADLVYFTLTPQQPVFYFRKYITFTHDLTMLKFARAGRLPNWLHAVRMYGYRFLLWDAHRMARQVIVPTQYVADAVNKYHLFTNRKTTVCLESSEPPLSGKAKKPEDAPEKFILYVGSAFPHKNLENLVTAFGLLKEVHEDLKLVLVGKREYYSKKLENWAKKQPCFDDIIFTGFVPDEELKWYYQNAETYVFPSFSEGFGLPSLEAMVHGCPVVSSNATCMPEVNGEAALYFDPHDVAEIAERINEMISNKELRRKCIAKGYTNARKYSWHTFAAKHLELFNEVLGD